MIKYIDRIKKFDYLVRHSMTGCPTECAHKLGISRSRFYEFLEDLELLGIPLEYSKEKKSYIYREPGKVVLGFTQQAEALSSDQMRAFKGGVKRKLNFRLSEKTGQGRFYNWTTKFKWPIKF